MKPTSLFLATLLAATPAFSATSPTAPVTHAEFEKMVHDYLVEHPEVIVEAVESMQKREEKKAGEKASQAVKTNQAEIYDGKDTPSYGDKATAEVTIVEFFDYNCGVCKNMFGALDKLAKDPTAKVRVLFKEFPIFGQPSEELAKIALAVNRLAPSKYYEFHSALMRLPGHADNDMIVSLLKSLGLDPVKVKEIAARPDIAAVIDKNHEIGEQLGIKGTPTLIIGDEVVPHALSFKEMIIKIVQQKQLLMMKK